MGRMSTLIKTYDNVAGAVGNESYTAVLLDEKVKIGGIKQPDCFVRFNVLNPNKTKYISETWKDKELFDSFIKFNNTLIS
ncbi:MAG: hypothetical protein LUG66_00665 [Clostridiales bacterium]|nr:hypothetical protein [Clostridiales bacterium]